VGLSALFLLSQPHPQLSDHGDRFPLWLVKRGFGFVSASDVCACVLLVKVGLYVCSHMCDVCIKTHLSRLCRLCLQILTPDCNCFQCNTATGTDRVHGTSPLMIDTKAFQFFPGV
jgi:hypothetical protein